jgi:hypothetical protein
MRKNSKIGEPSPKGALAYNIGQRPMLWQSKLKSSEGAKEKNIIFE